MKITTLIVDASPFIYSAFSTVGHFKTTTGIPTGVLYGVLRQLRAARNRFHAERVIVCYDSPGEVLKAAGAEGYKANRAFTEDKQRMYEQVPALQNLLSHTSFDQFWAPGYEADDLVGSLTRETINDSLLNHVVIMSPDNDLVQLLDQEGRVQLWTGGSKGYLKTWGWCQLEFGVAPDRLLLWRAAKGDTSDNLEGAFKDKGKLNELQRFLQSPDFGTSHTIEQFLATDSVEERERFFQNVETMRLHRVPWENRNLFRGARDLTALEAEFTKYEFKSMMKHLEEFIS